MTDGPFHVLDKCVLRLARSPMGPKWIDRFRGEVVTVVKALDVPGYGYPRYGIQIDRTGDTIEYVDHDDLQMHLRR